MYLWGIDLIQVEETKRGRGLPKITVLKVVKKVKEGTKNMILNTMEWWRTKYQLKLLSWPQGSRTKY
jgi:hypothetical protein